MLLPLLCELHLDRRRKKRKKPLAALQGDPVFAAKLLRE